MKQRLLIGIYFHFSKQICGVYIHQQHCERFYDEFVFTLCMVRNMDKNLFDGRRGFTFEVRTQLLSVGCKSTFVGIVCQC